MKRRRDPARKAAFRRQVLLGAWLLAGVVLLCRSVQVQVIQGEVWREVAERQHRRSLTVPAPRGRILDRDGTPLVVSHERIRVAVAPREVSDTSETSRLLSETLDLDSRIATRILGAGDPWVVLPGSHPPALRKALGGVRGIYLQREMERLLPHGELALGALGRVRAATGVGGIEQAFDSVLAGHEGREVQARDNLGRPIPGESFVVRPPRTGGEVVLTLDLDLQEIGREALQSAIEETGAEGGDLLITDPATGEILALVSLRDGASGLLSAINAPYEPGSILKPFTIAGLLARDLVDLQDTVDTEVGRLRLAGRTLSDVGPAEGRISVARALQVSSNVGVAKAAMAYEPAEQYETLRDFGFGAPTGIELPGEASGLLRRPEDWSRQSPASLAIGYEIAVTPIQMAMAYGALANGGWLMEPRIVRGVRGPAGSTLQVRRPRKVRRVVPESVAGEIGRVLVDAVEEGSGSRARLTRFTVAGKSGTSRAYDRGAGYQPGEYYSSFVGFFPAEDPQLVVFVKLERPEGDYYGGATAAPVTRATLEAILAARQAPLDRRSLVTMARRREAEPPPEGAARLVSRNAVDRVPGRGWEDEVARGVPGLSGRGSADADAGSRRAGEGDAGGNLRVGPDTSDDVETRVRGQRIPVPDVSGLPLRVAVRRIHSLGLRARWTDEGAESAIRPEPGTRLALGDTVEILGGSW